MRSSFYEQNRSTAVREMMDFVRDLTRYVKAKTNGEFLIIAQKGERLLEHAHYRDVVNGIAKEYLFYGYDGAQAFTPPSETEYSQQFLRRARDEGLPVLTVDYASVGSDYRREEIAAEEPATPSGLMPLPRHMV